MATALVLGAGGSVGFAYHVGTLTGLADAGWDPRDADVIVGTSTGAIAAALLRAGLAPGDLYCGLMGTPLSEVGRRLLAEGEHLLTLMAHMRRGGARPGRPASVSLLAQLARRPQRIRPGLFLAGVRPTGTVSTEPLAEVFRSAYACGRTLSHGGDDDLWPRRPLWLCTLDLDSGQRVVLGQPPAIRVDIGTAVAASAAVPSFFAPVVVDGRRLVDGGLHSPVNADVLAGTRFDRVIVSAPMGVGALPHRFGLDLPGRMLNHWTARKELAPFLRGGVSVELHEPGPNELALMHYDAFETDHLPAIAAMARAASDGLGARRPGEPAG